MRLSPTCTSRLVVVLSLCAAIWNIFVVVNYQNEKKSLKMSTDDIHEQRTTLFTGETKPRSYLKSLQMGINETFRRFEEKYYTTGKAFRLAVLHEENGRERRDVEKIKTALPGCQQKPFLLILVHSAPANFMEREAIRMSWGRPQNSMNEANAGKQLMPWWVNNSFISFKLLQPSAQCSFLVTNR